MADKKSSDKTKYYKILSNDFINYDHKYTDGLNKLNGEFNSDPTRSCCKGRLYAATQESIKDFFSYGTWLAEITLPKNNPEFKMIEISKHKKIGANMLNVDAKYSLYDINTYKRIGLTIFDNRDIVDFASKYNNINFLKWTMQYSKVLLGLTDQELSDPSEYKFVYTGDSMDCASQEGNIEILQWWKESKLPIKYTDGSMCEIPLKSLEWWLNSGLELMCTNVLMDTAVDTKVLEWGKQKMLENKEIKLSYTEWAIHEASRKGRIPILDWWLKSSGLPLKYNNCAMNEASRGGLIDVMEWWKNSGLEVKYNNRTINDASKRGLIDVMEWWKNSGLEVKYNNCAMNDASKGGLIDVMEWWKNSGLEVKYNELAFSDFKSEEIKEKSMKWWYASGLKVLIDEDNEVTDSKTPISNVSVDNNKKAPISSDAFDSPSVDNKSSSGDKKFNSGGKKSNKKNRRK
jgi:hypothetical protein